MIEFADIEWEGRSARLEYEWVGEGRSGHPLIVFLHEGLGSRAMWRDFPARLCEAAGAGGLVFSRPGFGRSSPRAAGERWDIGFLHEQAHRVLPAFLEALGLRAERPWLFGHSDGGSIALLYAARFPEAVSGIVVVAPHIFVEDATVRGLEAARSAYESSDWGEKLARYHDDPDAVFRGWNDLWLAPGFKAWNIEEEIATIRSAVLAVQGVDDEYATLAQIRGIARRVPQTQLLELPGGHSPHREQAGRLIAATVEFMRSR